MAGNHLLDTNIVMALTRNEPAIEQRIRGSSSIYYASIVLGELYHGAYNSDRSERNIRQIDNLALGNTVLSCDTETARIYGRLKSAQRAKGRPIPENDLWIAALAVQHSLTLVTRDAHFDNIDSLATERW